MAAIRAAHQRSAPCAPRLVARWWRAISTSRFPSKLALTGSAASSQLSEEVLAHTRVLQDIHVGLAPTRAPPVTSSRPGTDIETVDVAVAGLPDAMEAVEGQLAGMTANLESMLAAGGHTEILPSMASYILDNEGKQVRPRMVLLTAAAASYHPRPNRIPVALADVLDADPLAVAIGGPGGSQPGPRIDSPLAYDPSTLPESGPALLASQIRLAEITELLHAATLIHDDVIDASPTRRGKDTLSAAFGNKAAVLVGDFLLARASVSLARLRSYSVMELYSTIIAHLAEGELMQASVGSSTDWNTYLRKTYCKTATLMANSLRGTAILGGHSAAIVEAAAGFGSDIGIAFQLVDDILDYVGSDRSLGKPAGADAAAGIVTAPLLFALEQHSGVASAWADLQAGTYTAPSRDDAVQALVKAVVSDTDAIPSSRALAKSYIDSALAGAAALGPSPAATALADLALSVLSRSA